MSHLARNPAPYRGDSDERTAYLKIRRAVAGEAAETVAEEATEAEEGRRR